MKSRRTFYWIAGISLVLAILPFELYFAKFNSGLSADDQNWANFGSFVGGILTSVFSFTSFILVLYTLLRSIEDKTRDDRAVLFFRHLELIANCRTNITVNVGAVKRQGQEVFSDFSGIVATFSMNPRIAQIGEKSNRSDNEQAEFQGHCTNYIFFRNSVRPFTNLLDLAFKFILSETGENLDRFLGLLVSQLSEQEIMAYGIMNHKTIDPSVADKIFIDTVQFDGIRNMAEKSENLLKRMIA